MARKKKEQATSELNREIFVGFVNSFTFEDKAAKKALNGHPKQGRLYQIIKDTQYGYRIHIGAENTPSGMEGILLGEELKGEYEGKWAFDVSIVTKDNFLEFNINDEDALKLGQWFDTDNKDLKAVLTRDVTLASTDENGHIIEIEVDTPKKEDADEANVYDKMAQFEDEYGKKMRKFSEDLTLLSYKDSDFFNGLADLVSYLGTTYSDKYEANGRPNNMSKDFLLSSQSSEVAIFNSFKYLQRYCTTGFEKSQNVKDLYKAIHYILFEIQRKRRHEQ